MGINAKTASKEEIARGLELLEKENLRKEKIARGEIKGYKKYSEMNDEEKAKARAAAKKRLVRQRIILNKALAQGITATEEEIQIEMDKPA